MWAGNAKQEGLSPAQIDEIKKDPQVVAIYPRVKAFETACASGNTTPIQLPESGRSLFLIVSFDTPNDTPCNTLVTPSNHDYLSYHVLLANIFFPVEYLRAGKPELDTDALLRIFGPDL